MFTGIIESLGKVVDIQIEGGNMHFCIESNISGGLKVDQSISHSGVCLTVTKVAEGMHWVTAIQETIIKSNLGSLFTGGLVNLERCMLSNGRFDGHIVQGHVDQIGKCVAIQEQNGSCLYQFEFDPSTGNMVVEKGSVAVNGVSLTCFQVKDNGFTVAIIPYTYAHTNFHTLKADDTVNLEFDIIGKYVKRLLSK